MDLRKVSVELLVPWKDNPREMTTADAERLRKQILLLGVYKPLLVVEEDGKFTVLGGNMRTQIFKTLGITEIEVSVVNAPTKADKIRYALSDNDRAGAYDQRKLAKLIRDERGNIDTEDFKIESGWLFPLSDVVKLHEEPGEGESMARPEFKEIIDKFDEGEKGKSKENGNWFYIEYYADDETFENLFKILKGLGKIKGRHEIDNTFFASLIVKEPQSINDVLKIIHEEIPQPETETEEVDETPPTLDMFPPLEVLEGGGDPSDDAPEDLPEDLEE